MGPVEGNYPLMLIAVHLLVLPTKFSTAAVELVLLLNTLYSVHRII